MDHKKKIVIVILAVLLIAATIGTVSAYMFKKSQSITNLFTPATVDCAITMNQSNDRISQVQISNTGSINAYLRIRFVTYWVDENGQVVSKPSTTLQISMADGWIAGSDNTFYYRAPVAPSSGSLTLFADGFTLDMITANDGTRQVVQVFGEAIQAAPESSAKDAWGVQINNGEITAVP